MVGLGGKQISQTDQSPGVTTQNTPGMYSTSGSRAAAWVPLAIGRFLQVEIYIGPVVFMLTHTGVAFATGRESVVQCCSCVIGLYATCLDPIWYCDGCLPACWVSRAQVMFELEMRDKLVVRAWGTSLGYHYCTNRQMLYNVMLGFGSLGLGSAAAFPLCLFFVVDALGCSPLTVIRESTSPPLMIHIPPLM